MTALGRKAYWDTFSPSPELVIMFLPGEMLFSAALQSDPSLIELGVNEKVVLATPTTLIALLRTVAYAWTQEALALNAQEVAQLGKQLYERIASLAAHWSDVGDKLEKAVGSYNKSVGTLETRVLVTARKFVDLKAAPEDGEIEAPQPVDTLPRALQAPELAPPEARRRSSWRKMCARPSSASLASGERPGASKLLVQQVRETLVCAVEHGAPLPFLELQLAAVAQVLLERGLELRRDAGVEDADADLLVERERARVEIGGADVRPDFVHDDDLLVQQRRLELVQPDTGFEQRGVEVAARAPHERTVRVLARQHQMHLDAAAHHHRE